MRLSSCIFAFLFCVSCQDGSEDCASGGAGGTTDSGTSRGGTADTGPSRGGAGGGCRAYCGAEMWKHDVSARCDEAHFSGNIPTQCPAGEVPAGCDSLSAYSPGVVSTCPGETVSEEVWCCAQ